MELLYPPNVSDDSEDANRTPNGVTDPEPALNAPTDLDPNAECPFHTMIRQLAGTAVKQHILHLEGEVLPRADLVAALDTWHGLYHLLRTHVCPATRTAALPPADVEAMSDTFLAHSLTPTQASLRTSLCRQLARCAGGQSAQDCPLHFMP